MSSAFQPLEACLDNLHVHYPHAFVCQHWSSGSHSLNKFIIVHPGTNSVTEPMLVILYFGHDDTSAYAVLSCFDDGDSICIVEAMGTQEMVGPNRYYYGNHLINTIDTDDEEDNYFQEEIRKTLNKIFPYRSLFADCSIVGSVLERQQFWNIIDWVGYNHYRPLLKAEYRMGWLSIESVETCDTSNPWLVSYTERLKQRQAEAKKEWDYELRCIQYGQAASTRIAKWWKRKRIAIRAQKMAAICNMLDLHKCHSKLLKEAVVSFNL